MLKCFILDIYHFQEFLLPGVLEPIVSKKGLQYSEEEMEPVKIPTYAECECRDASPRIYVKKLKILITHVIIAC